jgi:hypothetical protein
MLNGPTNPPLRLKTPAIPSAPLHTPEEGGTRLPTDIPSETRDTQFLKPFARCGLREGCEAGTTEGGSRG